VAVALLAKIGLPGLVYAYVVDELTFGEETPEDLRTFYAESFDRLPEPAGGQGPVPRDGPPARGLFPCYSLARKGL